MVSASNHGGTSANRTQWRIQINRENPQEENMINAEVLFRAVHHRTLVLAGLAAVDCGALRSPSSFKG